MLKWATGNDLELAQTSRDVIEYVTNRQERTSVYPHSVVNFVLYRTVYRVFAIFCRKNRLFTLPLDLDSWSCSCGQPWRQSISGCVYFQCASTWV